MDITPYVQNIIVFFQKMRKAISIVILIAFIGMSVNLPALAQVSSQAFMPRLPEPGVMVNLSPTFTPAHLLGMTIYPENPFEFDFLINRGDQELSLDQKKDEYKKLIKYFLASLTIPNADQWVNLSPYEKDKIIKGDFGKTEMGRDLLTQDYLLKQITSSLIYPESNLGKEFWGKIYQRAWDEFHTTQVPVNTFNKVWIVPDHAIVYESGRSVFILNSHLKVMLEEDYLSLKEHTGITAIPIQKNLQSNNTHTIGSQVIREIILPELEKEVNEGKNFANLRQMFNGMILATWYKNVLKESLLGKIYADKSKVSGVDQNPQNNEIIYQRYLKAFKKGVFNYIKEDIDKYTNEEIPRKYFSGGWDGLSGKVVNFNEAMTTELPNLDSKAVLIVKSGLADLLTIVARTYGLNNLRLYVQEGIESPNNEQVTVKLATSNNPKFSNTIRVNGRVRTSRPELRAINRVKKYGKGLHGDIIFNEFLNTLGLEMVEINQRERNRLKVLNLNTGNFILPKNAKNIHKIQSMPHLARNFVHEMPSADFQLRQTYLSHPYVTFNAAMLNISPEDQILNEYIIGTNKYYVIGRKIGEGTRKIPIESGLIQIRDNRIWWMDVNGRMAGGEEGALLPEGVLAKFNANPKDKLQALIAVFNRALSRAIISEEGKVIATKQTILIIDDSKDYLTMVRDMVTDMGDYKILTASSPQEAEDLWKEHKSTINLIISDTNRPGGLWTTEVAKFKNEKKDIPIIALSALDNSKLWQGITEHFIEKTSIDYETLKNKIHEVLPPLVKLTKSLAMTTPAKGEIEFISLPFKNVRQSAAFFEYLKEQIRIAKGHRKTISLETVNRIFGTNFKLEELKRVMDFYVRDGKVRDIQIVHKGTPMEGISFVSQAMTTIMPKLFVTKNMANAWVEKINQVIPGRLNVSVHYTSSVHNDVGYEIIEPSEIFTNNQQKNITILMGPTVSISNLMTEMKRRFINPHRVDGVDRFEEIEADWNKIMQVPWSDSNYYDLTDLNAKIKEMSYEKIADIIGAIKTKTGDEFSAFDPESNVMIDEEWVIQKLFQGLNKGEKWSPELRGSYRFIDLDENEMSNPPDLKVPDTLRAFSILAQNRFLTSVVHKVRYMTRNVKGVKATNRKIKMSIGGGVALVGIYALYAWITGATSISHPYQFNVIGQKKEVLTVNAQKGESFAFVTSPGYQPSVVVIGNSNKVSVIKTLRKLGKNVHINVWTGGGGYLGDQVNDGLVGHKPDSIPHDLGIMEKGTYNVNFYWDGESEHMLLSGYGVDYIYTYHFDKQRHQDTFQQDKGPLNDEVNVYYGSGITNKAMNSNQDTITSKIPYGGIDFNAANFNMYIKRDGHGMPLPWSKQDMAQLSKVAGFIPQIIEIKPANNVPIISELRQKLQTLGSLSRSS